MTTDTSVAESTPGFDRALIIGCGLIGGSLGHGLVHHRVCGRVIGYDANAANADKALSRGLLDEVATSLDAAIASVDLVILAVPVGRTADLVKHLARGALAHSIIVDSGSVKQAFAQQCAQSMPEALRKRVIPCHPIAGHVTAGPEHADRALMAGRPMIMTPSPDTDPGALERVGQMWKRIGFDILTMSVQEHDAMYADLSHMPHVIAFTLMKHIRERGMRPDILKMFAGNAFKDMTHHAGQNPRMWRDIFHTNRQEICRSLAGFRKSLDELERVINSDDQDRLERVLTQLQEARLHTWQS
ncbi:prephenate dehydrogenase [Candidimonas sp. SYP-B2681]|uniref:prephenate dehydrogenase n=1 Tax=Candidimonas sp. SYP-B2681 TaxID=2497686 RepID=UPI000F8813BD|nr:prephenate dehydrogenase [Candidimonas sp. SYP-B2681]RTZ41495.1 prephenate dehydrogenase [Candidimonas sp. SYP-B2681]